jgi:hypothetical protein
MPSIWACQAHGKPAGSDAWAVVAIIDRCSYTISAAVSWSLMSSPTVRLFLIAPAESEPWE